MGYRVTRVTAHYKGCIFLQSEYSQYIGEFLSTSLWVTGLQGLQHITRVAFCLKSEYSQYKDEFLGTSLWVTGLQGLQHITRVGFSKIGMVNF